MNPWRRLFDHYTAYHAYGPSRLRYVGYVGAISTVLFYFVRFTRPNAQPLDDLVPRVVGLVLYTLLAMKDRWPERLKPYYIGYSYVALICCLPFFMVLTGLQRGGGMPAISNAFIVVSFLVLVTDWRNTVVMLIAGTAVATAFYAATSPDPKIPMDMVAQLPAFALIVIGGNLFKFSTEQIDAERKLRATQALAGSIAHEMRNPLSQIRYNLQGMQEALPPPTASARNQTLAGAEVHALYRHLAESELAVKRGLQVIAMTLDEVSAKPVDTSSFQYFSAAQATHKAVQEYAFQSDDERANVAVHVAGDFIFRGDETAYLFVIFNLVKNALYYMAVCPQARVTVTVERHQVRIRDTGPGIPRSAIAGLFQPFSSSGKSGGTGLGLAYCRRIMRAFGGEISCESVPGEFTEFILEFPPVPRQESDIHRAAVLEKARGAFAGKRLLVVDDDAVQLAVAREKLRALGAQIDQAADGQAALHALAQERYDLVLLDLHMPVPDGYAVAEKIRAGYAPANREVRIVAHTSEPAHLAAIKTQKAGIDGLVTKPCDQLPLVQALLDALARPAPGDDAAAALAGRRILLADDNAYNRKAVAAYLRHAGAEVAEAAHGQAVLDRLEAAGPWDAILMDLNMPGMSGLDAAGAIRGSGASWRQIPIIALTAHSDPKTVQAARAAGMNDFITKPVEAGELYSKLHRVVARGADRGGIGVLPAQSEPAGAEHGTVLNVQRLESYRRIGMLEELLNDYVPEIARLVSRLEHSFAERDLQVGLDALHSLLGMSGEAGALALHRLVRSVYGPMTDSGAWPADDAWLARIRTAATDAQQALQAYAPASSTVTAD